MKKLRYRSCLGIALITIASASCSEQLLLHKEDSLEQALFFLCTDKELQSVLLQTDISLPKEQSHLLCLFSEQHNQTVKVCHEANTSSLESLTELSKDLLFLKKLLCTTALIGAFTTLSLDLLTAKKRTKKTQLKKSSLKKETESILDQNSSPIKKAF